ncbi:Histidine triad nucleotide-binding protein 3 [Mactra antiquata]
MTTLEKCVFCKIVHGQDEKTEILHKDERIVVFRDIRPATPHHYLVVTKEHIPDAKQLKYSHIELVESMIAIGKDVVTRQGGDVDDLRMGFHWPPFHAISHLHLHVISSTSKIGWIASGIYMINSPWFASVDWLLKRLKGMAP